MSIYSLRRKATVEPEPPAFGAVDGLAVETAGPIPDGLVVGADPDDLTPRELRPDAAIADLVSLLRADRPRPLFLQLSDVAPVTADVDYWTERVPLGAVWRIGAVCARGTVAGSAAVYLDDVDPGRQIGYVVTPGVLVYPALWLRAGQRLAVTVSGGVGSAQYVTVTGEMRYVG